MDRRDFLTGAAAPRRHGRSKTWRSQPRLPPRSPSQVLVPSIWSRHVQWVKTAAQTDSDPYGTGVAVGEAILAGGYTAVDLTVRDGGHVRPALVATNLPLMLQGIRSTGAICTMIGTNFGPPSDPRTRPGSRTSSCTRFCRWPAPTASPNIATTMPAIRCPASRPTRTARK